LEEGLQKKEAITELFAKTAKAFVVDI